MTTTNPVNNNNNNIEWYTYYKNQETNTCSTCSPDPGLTAMLVCLLYVALLIPHTQIVTAKLVVTISLTIVNLNHYATILLQFLMNFRVMRNVSQHLVGHKRFVSRCWSIVLCCDLWHFYCAWCSLFIMFRVRTLLLFVDSLFEAKVDNDKQAYESWSIVLCHWKLVLRQWKIYKSIIVMDLHCPFIDARWLLLGLICWKCGMVHT